MSDNATSTRLEPASAAPGLSSTWFFIKVTLGVILGLGALVVALSPRLYTGVNEDSPEYWQQKAKEHVQQKEYQQAIDAYKRVLSYEPARRQVFARAAHQIKSLQQLQTQREAGTEQQPATGESGGEETTEEESPPTGGTEETETEGESTADAQEEDGASPLDESLIP